MKLQVVKVEFYIEINVMFLSDLRLTRRSLYIIIKVFRVHDGNYKRSRSQVVHVARHFEYTCQKLTLKNTYTFRQKYLRNIFVIEL